MSTPYRVTPEFWDHATLWTDDEHDAGHATDGGRVFGVTRTRYAECDDYGCLKVAVINPENRPQVERLAREFFFASPSFARMPGEVSQSVIDGLWNDSMAAALRRLITPPKFDEPTGLGAVVEDADGSKWTLCRIDNAGGWVRFDGKGFWRMYADLDVVRVLSEGVTA